MKAQKNRRPLNLARGKSRQAKDKPTQKTQKKEDHGAPTSTRFQQRATSHHNAKPREGRKSRGKKKKVDRDENASFREELRRLHTALTGGRKRLPPHGPRRSSAGRKDQAFSPSGINCRGPVNHADRREKENERQLSPGRPPTPSETLRKKKNQKAAIPL